MFARVIVDVPARQTNREFDYLIPQPLRDWVEIGSRVGVPFGPRVVQGFVVDIRESSDYPDEKLREISRVLDSNPPLNRELVALGRWMSRQYVCHEITALQSMIPGALKAKYERIVSLPVHRPFEEDEEISAEVQEIIAYVRAKEPLATDQLLKRYPEHGSLIRELINQDRLVETRGIKDRLSKKKVTFIFPAAKEQLVPHLQEIPAKAHKQKELMQYLIEHPEPVKLADLSESLSISSQSAKALAAKGLLEIREVEVFRDPYEDRSFPQTSPLPLTVEQQAAFEQIVPLIRNREHGVFLLHGVTGSGKTEIYLQTIQQCLDMNREAIVLVPEIALTPQMVERFKSRFGARVAVLHSRLSHGERYDEWRKIQLGKADVAIGARSAVFAPFRNLGLIIIDEEHETSYKQEESPKYHAREAAIERAKQHRAVVVLGSATPSLESYHLAAEKKIYRLIRLASRVEGRPLPEVEIVDMRSELREGNRSMFSRALHRAIEERLQKKEQMVLLLNRRGHSTFIMCRSCGYVAGCPHCDISLTYHRHSRTVRCHYCGYAQRELTQCPECESEHIRFFGTGTQRVEEELVKLFPGIRVIRMDVDTTNQKGAHEKWLNQFKQRQADVLLGTQMVAKGLDFPHVTLVGVITADTVLNLPDFRSAEKTFQLLTQVAGRAGRHELPGNVIIQTYTPEHYSIQFAGEHDYIRFAETEMKLRRERNYPPYYRLALITLSHDQVPLLVRTGERLAEAIKSIAMSYLENDPEMAAYAGFEVLGPVASPIPRVKDRYRFQCMVKYRGKLPITDILRKAEDRLEDIISSEKLQISMDINPQMLM